MYEVKLLQRVADHGLVRALSFRQTLSDNRTNPIACKLRFCCRFALLRQVYGANPVDFYGRCDIKSRRCPEPVDEASQDLRSPELERNVRSYALICMYVAPFTCNFQNQQCA